MNMDEIKPWCDSCPSKGVRHKKECPKFVAKAAKKEVLLNTALTVKADPIPDIPKKDDVMAKLEMLTTSVSALADAVLAIQAGNKSTPQSPQTNKPVKKVVNNWMEIIPPHWMDAKDNILGKEFEMQMEWHQDGDCLMYITVPEELRRPDAKFRDKDVSTGLIRKVSPILDIETWCQRIKQNIQKYHPHFI